MANPINHVAANAVKRAYALALATKGCAIFPLHGMVDGKCGCGHEHDIKAAGNHPCGGFSPVSATTDLTVIEAWFDRWPNMNFGVAAGKDMAENGQYLNVLCFDPDADVDAVMTDVSAAAQQDLNVVAVVETPEGGMHVYVMLNPGTKIQLNGSKGVRVVAQGAWVPGPGSVHHSGKTYDWACDDAVSVSALQNADVAAHLCEVMGEQNSPSIEMQIAEGPPPVEPAPHADEFIVSEGESCGVVPKVGNAVTAALAATVRVAEVRLAAAQYKECGWELCGITKGMKGPTYSGWQEKPLELDQIGNHGLGLIHALSGTCAIDLDDLAAAVEWFAVRGVDIRAHLHADDAVQIKSGKANRAKLLFRLPAGMATLPTTKIKNPDGSMMVEFRCASEGDGAGCQDVLPPTIHPDTGLPYEWAGAGDFTNLPVLPTDLLGVWHGVAGGSVAKAERQPQQTDVIGEGGRNDALFKLAGDFARTGMSAEAINAALQVENQRRCSPPLPSAEVERIAKSASVNSKGAKAAMEAEPVDIEKLLERATEASASAMANQMMVAGIKLPPVMDAIIKWSSTTARTVQPAFALGTALAACGGVLARDFVGAAGAHTNLYCVVIGPTACGKENTLDTVVEIVAEYEANRLAGVPASDSGVLSAVKRHPASVFVMDEIGEVLKSIFSTQAAGHKAMIGTTFMELYTKGGKAYRGREYSDHKRDNPGERMDIYSPCPSIFGATTATTFYGGMNKSVIDSGFMPRLLVFRAPDEIPMPNVDWEPAPMPETVTGWLASIRERVKRHKDEAFAGANLAGVRTDNYTPVHVPFSPEAKVLFTQARVDIVNRRNTDCDALESNMLTRFVENAGRVALILALAEDPWAASVSVECLESALTIVKQAMAVFIADTRANLFDSHYAKLEAKTMAYIQDYLVKNKKPVTEGILIDRCTTYGAASPNDRKNAIEALVRQGRLAIENGRNNGSIRYVPCCPGQ